MDPGWTVPTAEACEALRLHDKCVGNEANDFIDGCMEGRRELLGSGRRPHSEVAGVAWLSQGRVKPVRVLVLAPRVVEATSLGGEVPIMAHHPDAVGHSGTKKCIGTLFEGNGKAQKTETDMQAYVKRPEMTLGSVAVSRRQLWHAKMVTFIWKCSC